MVASGRINTVMKKLCSGYNPRVAGVLRKHFGDNVAKGIASNSKIVTTFTGRVYPWGLRQILGNTSSVNMAINELRKEGLTGKKIIPELYDKARDIFNSLSLTSFGRVEFNQSTVFQPSKSSKPEQIIPLAEKIIPPVCYFKGNAEGKPTKKESPLERLKNNWGKMTLLKRFELLRQLSLEERVELFEAMDPKDHPEFFKTEELLIYIQLFKRSHGSGLVKLSNAILKARPEFPRILNLKELAKFYDNLDSKGRSKLRNAIAPGRVRLFKALGIKFFETLSPQGQVKLFKSLSIKYRAGLLNTAGEELLSELMVGLYNKGIIVDALLKPIKPSNRDEQKIVKAVNRIEDPKIKEEIRRLMEEHWGIELS